MVPEVARSGNAAPIGKNQGGEKRKTKGQKSKAGPLVFPFSHFTFFTIWPLVETPESKSPALHPQR